MSRAPLPTELDPAELKKIVALSWRPAWAIRSRAGCLAPLLAWWAARRAGARPASGKSPRPASPKERP